MDYERDTTFSNMYLGTEFRFDPITRAFSGIVWKFAQAPSALSKKAA